MQLQLDIISVLRIFNIMSFSIQENIAYIAYNKNLRCDYSGSCAYFGDGVLQKVDLSDLLNPVLLEKREFSGISPYNK